MSFPWFMSAKTILVRRREVSSLSEAKTRLVCLIILWLRLLAVEPTPQHFLDRNHGKGQEKVTGIPLRDMGIHFNPGTSSKNKTRVNGDEPTRT
jgi:hypothetical protein